MPPAMPRTAPAWLISFLGALSCAAPTPRVDVVSIEVDRREIDEASPEARTDAAPSSDWAAYADGPSSVTRGGTVLRVVGVGGPPDEEPTFRLMIEAEGDEPIVFHVSEVDLTRLSPNGRYYAARWNDCPGVTEAQSRNASICIYDIKNRSVWVIAEPSTEVWEPSLPVWSPDGRFLAWSEDANVSTRLRLADPARQTLRETPGAAHVVCGASCVATRPRWEDTATFVVAESPYPVGTEAWSSWFDLGRPEWHLVRYDTSLDRLGVVRTLDADEATSS
jgi:hypothetical protein